jgi:hypothetical protein
VGQEQVRRPPTVVVAAGVDVQRARAVLLGVAPSEERECSRVRMIDSRLA